MTVFDSIANKRSTAFWLVLALNLASFASLGWARGTTNQISEYVHNSWRSEDGLPQNSVMAILQTRDGYLWLGTQEGLVRFNGIGFTVLNKSNTPAFKLNDIRALVQDREGNLWIGSLGGGLIQYRDGTTRTYLHEDGLADNTVPAIIEDKNGGLWIGTDNGLSRFKDGKFTRFGKQAGLSDATIYSLAQDTAGDLWVGTAQGLDRIFHSDFQSQRVQRFLAGQAIKSLNVGPAGDLWVGTQATGLYRFAFATGDSNTHRDEPRQLSMVHYGTREGLPQATIRAILDEGTVVWAGTDGGGLCRLFPGSPGQTLECYAAKDGLTGNYVASIFRDREGSLWVGTATGGLNQFKAGRSQHLCSRR